MEPHEQELRKAQKELAQGIKETQQALRKEPAERFISTKLPRWFRVDIAALVATVLASLSITLVVFFQAQNNSQILSVVCHASNRSTTAIRQVLTDEIKTAKKELKDPKFKNYKKLIRQEIKIVQNRYLDKLFITQRCS